MLSSDEHFRPLLPSKKILYLGLDLTNFKTIGEVTHCPLIQIVPRPLSDPSIQDALKHFKEYTHVVVTSKSTVDILKDYLPASGISLGEWSVKSTFAVGKATAKHLEACGITPYLIAGEETSEGLLHELEQIDLNNAQFFWPHSARSLPVIENFFKAHAICYTACILYDTSTRIPPKLPDLQEYDEIVFTSPSTIDAFLEVFGNFPSHARLTMIGPVTARHLGDVMSLFSSLA